jgi:hypothetical protein
MKQFREHTGQFLIGLAIDWRRGELHFQSSVMLPDDART